MPCARWRPKMSAGPPAGKGTIRVSGLLGKACARARRRKRQGAQPGKGAAAREFHYFLRLLGKSLRYWPNPVQPTAAPIASIHSGWTLKRSSTAVLTAVIATKIQSWSTVRAMMVALAATSPTEIGTRPGLHGGAPRLVLEAPPQPQRDHGQDRRRPEDRDGRHQHAGEARDLPADQRHHHHVRARAPPARAHRARRSRRRSSSDARRPPGGASPAGWCCRRRRRSARAGRRSAPARSGSRSCADLHHQEDADGRQRSAWSAPAAGGSPQSRPGSPARRRCRAAGGAARSRASAPSRSAGRPPPRRGPRTCARRADRD